nr:uncharacterized protein LOC107449947 [Parasteatoda tepidariorum]
MPNINNPKRKVDQSMEFSSNKKLRIDVSKNDGLFSDDHMPDEVFPIGNDVFVKATTYRGFVTVHLRQYKKYCKIYYPTTEGITLRPWWIEYIMGRKRVPETKGELPGGLYPPEKEIQISTTVLDLMYKNVNLLDAFKTFCETPIEKALPSSLDKSLGEEFLLKTLKKSICDILIENGMKEPTRLAEELFGNRIETFNSFAFSLEVMELAEHFYSKLWDSQKSLLLKPVNYVTEEFFENLNLPLMLREAREYMCPSDTFEYFEDFVNSSM